MRCVDCELHNCVVGTHFCNYKGKSGRRKPRRISEEDAYKDVPCEYVEEPLIKWCRKCDDYAGDGMYCASNYLVYDFSTSADHCESHTKGADDE